MNHIAAHQNVGLKVFPIVIIGGLDSVLEPSSAR
jgi:hypothetical protein